MKTGTVEKERLGSENKNKQETNLLPIAKTDKKLLLPVVIKSQNKAIIELKSEYSKLKSSRSLKNFLKFIKAALLILGRFTKGIFIIGAKATVFVGVSFIVILSTAVITKNIVNSKYGVKPQKSSTFSIFQLKSDESLNKNK